MFVMFAAGAVLWAVTLARSRAHTHRLHILMGVLAAFKALTLLSQAGELHLVKTTGHTGNWNIAFYIFTFLRGILFFTARPRALRARITRVLFSFSVYLVTHSQVVATTATRGGAPCLN